MRFKVRPIMKILSVGVFATTSAAIVYGLGTNAGLQRMASLDPGLTARDLICIRRACILSELPSLPGRHDRHQWKFHSRERVIRRSGVKEMPASGTPKHFGAWDQNLTTQWHARYGGRGVMIYWHVRRGNRW